MPVMEDSEKETEESNKQERLPKGRMHYRNALMTRCGSPWPYQAQGQASSFHQVNSHALQSLMVVVQLSTPGVQLNGKALLGGGGGWARGGGEQEEGSQGAQEHGRQPNKPPFKGFDDTYPLKPPDSDAVCRQTWRR
eukprot:scaffold61297_cov20-Tisochrysis_lutea.AAC.1